MGVTKGLLLIYFLYDLRKAFGDAVLGKKAKDQNERTLCDEHIIIITKINNIGENFADL